MNLQILNGFCLKAIMTVLMVIDHVGQFFPDAPEYLRWIGRVVAPVFFFLATEGYTHTRDKTRYIRRLYISSLVMFLGNVILWILLKNEPLIPNNIFFTLAVNLSLIYIREKNVNNILLNIALVLLALFAEGSYVATILIMLFYYLKHDKKKMSIGYILISLLLIPNIQWMQVFSLPFILMYNGQRGPDIKRFFYIFYPVHIWFLFLISHFIYS